MTDEMIAYVADSIGSFFQKSGNRLVPVAQMSESSGQA